MSTNSIDPNVTLRQLLFTSPEHGPILECLGIIATGDEDRTLAELCVLGGLEAHTVARVLAAMGDARQQIQVVCLELMTLTQLCDHLEEAHRNIHGELKRLDRLTKTMMKVHAAENPQLSAIRKCFVTFQRGFKAHLRDESEQLFPICRLWATRRNEIKNAPFVLKPPLPHLEREHSRAEESLTDLRSMVTGDVTSSAAKIVLRTIAFALAHLERSVHEQIYKENQVLFTRASALGGR